MTLTDAAIRAKKPTKKTERFQTQPVQDGASKYTLCEAPCTDSSPHSCAGRFLDVTRNLRRFPERPLALESTPALNPVRSFRGTESSMRRTIGAGSNGGS
jgi:hypothetical protein